MSETEHDSQNMLVKGGEDMIPQMFKVAHSSLTPEALAGLREHLKTVDGDELAMLEKVAARMNISVEVAKAGDVIMKGVIKSFIAAHVPEELAKLIFMFIDAGPDNVNVKVVNGGDIEGLLSKLKKDAEKREDESDNLLNFRKPQAKDMVH